MPGFKFFGIGGSVIGIIQGFIGFVGSLIGLLYYYGCIPPPEGPKPVSGTDYDVSENFNYILYTFFLDPNYEDIDMNINSETFSGFLWAYFSYSVVWLGISVAFLLYLHFERRKEIIIRLLFGAWAVMVLLILALDMTLTTLLGVDIAYLRSERVQPKKLANFDLHVLSIAIKKIPALYLMLSVALRFILIWLLDFVYMFIFVRYTTFLHSMPPQ